MSCAPHPALCGVSEFRLRAPMARPPESGWRIKVLPAQAIHLQSAWDSVGGEVSSSKAAWSQLLDFLKANKISVPLKQIQEESIEQWCRPEPQRCKGYRPGKDALRLPWAQERWEWANTLLVNPPDPKAALTEIVIVLTARINGPDGCVLCARHWDQVLADNPVPEDPTLDEARRWLVDRHNDSREGKKPTPFEVVAVKFNWTPE